MAARVDSPTTTPPSPAMQTHPGQTPRPFPATSIFIAHKCRGDSLQPQSSSRTNAPPGRHVKAQGQAPAAARQSPAGRRWATVGDATLGNTVKKDPSPKGATYPKRHPKPALPICRPLGAFDGVVRLPRAAATFALTRFGSLTLGCYMRPRRGPALRRTSPLANHNVRNFVPATGPRGEDSPLRSA